MVRGQPRPPAATQYPAPAGRHKAMAGPTTAITRSPTLPPAATRYRIRPRDTTSADPAARHDECRPRDVACRGVPGAAASVWPTARIGSGAIAPDPSTLAGESVNLSSTHRLPSSSGSMIHAILGIRPPTKGGTGSPTVAWTRRSQNERAMVNDRLLACRARRSAARRRSFGSSPVRPEARLPEHDPANGAEAAGAPAPPARGAARDQGQAGRRPGGAAEAGCSRRSWVNLSSTIGR